MTSICGVILHKKVCRACLTFEDGKKYTKLKKRKRFFTSFTDIEFDSTRKHWLCLECATRISNILTFIDKVVKVDAELQKIIGKLKNGEKVSLQHVSNASKLCKFPKLGSSNITSVDLETSAPHQQWLSSNMLMEYFDVDQMLIKDESKIDAYDDALDHNDGFYDDDDDVFKAAERNIDESIMDLNIGGIKIEDDDSDYYPLSTKRYKSSKSFEPKLEDDEYNGINSDKVITITLSLEEQIAEHEQLKLEKFSVEAPYRCNLCFKGFSYEETYNSHLSTHNEGYGEFKCAICHKYLKARNSYQSHMLNHSKKYKCRLCDYTRTWRTLVLEHYSVVHEKKSDVSFCDLCGKQFKKKSLLKHHLRNSHRAVKRLNCDHCQKTFKSFYTLRQHMATQHLRNRPENEKRFPCSVCGDRFRTKTCLRIHQVKHSTDRNYYCVECDMYFKTKMILKAHMKKTAKHIDPETLVSCPHCPYRSINEKELTAHIERIHLLITNFQCSMCPRAFYAGNSLRRHHRKVHEGIKAPRLHVCDVCGKAFPVRRMLTSHSNIHTGEKPYACTECDAKFAGSGALYTHVQLVHRKLKRDAQGRFKVKPDAQEEPNNKLQPVPT